MPLPPKPPPTGVVILLVQRPACALKNSTLHLALDVASVNHLAHVHEGRVAQDFHFPCVWINLDVHDVARKLRADAALNV